MQTAAVILAAGYGSFWRMPDGIKFPKVLEDLGGMPILEHVIRTARAAGLGPIVVVVNPLTGPLIQRTLEERGIVVQYATQLHRMGTADAARLGVVELTGNEVSEMTLARVGLKNFVLLFGDSPLWQPATLQAIAAAVNAKDTRTAITTFPLYTAPQMVRHYELVMRDEQGYISGILTRKEAAERHLPLPTSLNAALYAFNMAWFTARSSALPLTFKDRLARLRNQGERRVPPLIATAYQEAIAVQGWGWGWHDLFRERLVQEISLENPIEALGVNTKKELKFIRELHGAPPKHTRRRIGLVHHK